MPPLRERREDIPLLVAYYLNRYARKAGKHFTAVDRKSLDLLQSYGWPGNIRELQNVIERSVIVSESQTFSVDQSWLSRRQMCIRDRAHTLHPTNIAKSSNHRNSTPIEPFQRRRRREARIRSNLANIVPPSRGQFLWADGLGTLRLVVGSRTTISLHFPQVSLLHAER